MKIWLLEQNVNNGYDTYDSAVVIAKDEAAARQMHPSPWAATEAVLRQRTWAAPEEITVTYLGKAAPGSQPRVVCASFNAG